MMECFGEEAPLTLMQLVKRLKETAGWAQSTTSTMVRYMEEKGLISSRPNGREKDFYPNVNRDAAVMREIRVFSIASTGAASV